MTKLDKLIEMEELRSNVRKAEASAVAKDAEVRRLRKALADETEERQRLETALGLITKVTDAHPAVPKWEAKPLKGKGHRATPVLLLSDLHLDEVVNPHEIGHYNAFNRKIAEMRLRRTFEQAVNLSRNYVNGITFDGFVLAMGGDLLSGDIHTELARTNESTVFESIAYWVPLLAAGIEMLADEFGSVRVPCVTGNHDRNPMNKKLPAKLRATDSLSWVMYSWLRDRFLRDKRVTFEISAGADHRFNVYDTKYLLTHGDQFRGGGGIAGVMSPIMRGHARKLQRYQAMRDPFDWMILGHFHQYLMGRGFIINGCFTESMEVTTPYGPKAIGTVEIGDVVLSRDGTWQKVSHVFEKQSDHGLVKLTVRGLPVELECTPNHLIWAIKGESNQVGVSPKRRHLIAGGDAPQWIPADFVSPGDWVHVPHCVGNETPISEDLAWLYGLYLAEGHTILRGGASKKHHRVEFSMHMRELPILEQAKRIMETELGISGRLSVRQSRTTSHLVCSVPEETAERWRELFGHKAIGKRVPDWFHSMAPHLKAAVVEGWFTGDGHERPDGVRSATTISPQLAYAMFDLALGAGMRPSLATLAAGGRRKNRSYTIHFNRGQESVLIDGEVFYRVQHRFRSREIVPVFDLEVTGEHTYVVNRIGVHNSLKGYDEYAAVSNFEAEAPQQAFWITTPERGITMSMPIACEHPKEGWR